MKIAVIGAGIVGLLTALEFLDQGEQVIIFDQQQAGTAASWAGGGILSPMYPWRYAPAVNALAQHGKTMYQALNQRCQAVTGIDFEIHDTGMMIFDESDFDIGLNYAEQTQQAMQRCQLLPQHELQQHLPQVNAKFKHALYFPELSNVRNPRLLQSLIAYIQQHPNAQLMSHTPIVDFKRQQQRITAVISQKGETFACDTVIFCTGAWSAQWQKLAGMTLNIRPVHGQMLLFKTPPQWLKTMCMNHVMYLIPRQDGHIVCGSSMNDFGFDDTVRDDIRQDILTASLEMIPDLAQFPIVKQWAGLRPASPDGIPFIGRLPNIENAWANFGHFRNGLVMAPASARLLRQMFYEQETIVDPSAYQMNI